MVNVIDDTPQTEVSRATGRRMPAWVLKMAGDYAAANGLAEIKVTDYFKTEEYKSQARRNVAAAARMDRISQ